jgi:hypothetical protein
MNVTGGINKYDTLIKNQNNTRTQAKTEYKIVKLLNQKITHPLILKQLNLKLNNNKET